MLFRLLAPRQGPNPVRVPRHDFTMRAGDDLKIVFTLLEDDGETLSNVEFANARMALFHDERPCGSWHDYGLGWWTYSGRPSRTLVGWPVPGRLGRINFWLPSAEAGDLFGRYRLYIEIDQPDGVSTGVEGILQVRESRNGLGNAPRPYLITAGVPLGVGMIPQLAEGGIPVDADGFPLLEVPPVLPPVVVVPPVVITDPGSSSVLGFGVLGQVVLGSGTGSGGGADFAGSTLGTGVLGQMVLGA